MAKDPASQSQANDTVSAEPTRPRTRRGRAQSVPSSLPASLPTESSAVRSESMASEPSEEDIRMRAYQRYLERGGGHGLDFDDWLEAEKELRRQKP